jgi:L-fuculose-phosphate aldolase
VEEPVGLRVREALTKAMKLLYERGLVNLRGGNASAKLVLPNGVEYVYITPSGRPKPLLRPSDIAVVAPDGAVIEGQPSSELKLHLYTYAARRDVRAVVHAHNPLAVAVASLGMELTLARVTVESRYYVGGCVAKVPYYEPGSEELARAVARAVRECDVVVLENHGAVAVGKSHDPVEAVFEALDRLEALEDAARVLITRYTLSLARLWSQHGPR